MPEHLRLDRELPITERHRPPDRRPRFRPADPRQFGRDLVAKLAAARVGVAETITGYDERFLLKILLRSGESLPNLDSIPGIELVSHEDRSIVLAFATAEGIAAVESRLLSLSRDGTVTGKQVLYAVENFSHWSPDDRMGNALRAQGVPQEERFIVDVELWPQERGDRRRLMLTLFQRWLDLEGIALLDTLTQPSLVMTKVLCDRKQLEGRLLRHRDVRTVDLPPRFGIQLQTLLTDIGGIPPPAPPGEDAPPIAVLDSGLTTGHPLIATAVGDAQGFVPPERGSDDHVPEGHGTSVCGLALYPDIAAAIRRGRFAPQLRLFSGKVFRDDGTDQTTFVERAVEEAVEYFVAEYNCRVFNLSYGDANKIYDGRHVRGLAYTLDRLSRERGVLFVVSSGNLRLNALPSSVRERYPEYLFAREGRILDPGTALNAVTVGALAQHDATLQAQRYPDTLESVPIAQANQPSPITRCGPSVKGAVKPDLVEYAGNVAIDRRGKCQTRGLGVLSLNSGYAQGRPFCENVGSSYAAPVVAHKAARLRAELPDASPHLLRALLGAHARWPAGSVAMLDPHREEAGRERLLRAVGYGMVDDRALYRSVDGIVTLVVEETIGVNNHHFFEVPLPKTWWEGKRRLRAVSVALAYAPEVRTTRLDYRATKIGFRLVAADSLDRVTQAFRRRREKGMKERVRNRWISSEKRNSGTLQVSRWQFKGRVNSGRLFIVVTRQDAPWSSVSDQPESYALSVVLDDRERADASLYAEVRAVLQARTRARVQV